MAHSAKVLVIGAGPAGQAHVEALRGLVPWSQIAVFAPTGRNRSWVVRRGLQFFSGGLFETLNQFSPTHCVVAVPVQSLYEVTLNLLEMGVQRILIEKPGFLYVDQGRHIHKLADQIGANVVIGYNRRWYKHVQTIKEFLSDGPILEIEFDFSEDGDRISRLPISPVVKERWLATNTVHLLDLAFYFTGLPDPFLSQFKRGGSLDWHPSASWFEGEGETSHGALFKFRADWNRGGPWSLKWRTPHVQYVLSPLETLSIQHGEGTADLDPDPIDTKYKAGFFRQMEAFLHEKPSEDLSSPIEATALLRLAEVVGGYSPSSIRA